jgi:FkbM family methyltransferase
VNRVAAVLRETLERTSNVIRRSGQPAGMRSALRLLARTGVEPATIADVGASDGRWSKFAGSVFPSADLVLFEPQPVHEPALERFQSDHPNATIVRSAVGGGRGISAFDAADPWAGVLERQPTANSITVPVVTLDDALADARPPFLVKLDTHGVEAEILEGAASTLTRSVAWVIEAYNHRIAPGSLLFWELCSYMVEQGFRPIDLVDVLHRPYDGALWQADFFFVRSDWPGFGYVSYT